MDKKNDVGRCKNGIRLLLGYSMSKPTLLKITDNACVRVAELMASAPEGALGLRVFIGTSGCSGYKYEIEYAMEQRNFEESVDAKNGNVVLIAPDALMFLIGSTMDFVDSKLHSGFDFTNPNEKGRCGCGESFSI